MHDVLVMMTVIILCQRMISLPHNNLIIAHHLIYRLYTGHIIRVYKRLLGTSSNLTHTDVLATSYKLAIFLFLLVAFVFGYYTILVMMADLLNGIISLGMAVLLCIMLEITYI
jgi:hypothetical protein